MRQAFPKLCYLVFSPHQLIAYYRSARRAWWVEWPYEPLGNWLKALWTLLRMETRSSRRTCGAEGPPSLPEGARICVVRLGHLGDVLHAVPFARAVRRQRPDVLVDIVVGPWCEALAKRFDCFSQVWVYAPDFVQYHRGDRRGVRSQRMDRQFFRELREQRYFACLAASPTHVSEQIILRACFPDIVFGAQGGVAEIPVGSKDQRRPHEGRIYEAAWVSSFLADLGLEVESAMLEFPLTSEERREASSLWGNRPRPWVILAPGAGWNGKRWPAERFAELGRQLFASRGASVALIGSPSEKEIANVVEAGMRCPCLNVTGQTGLGVSAALIAAADLLVGNDSAPIHFAAALGVPTVSLWGPTRPEKWAPQGPRHAVVRTPGACAGCIYWHPQSVCRGEPPCMTTIACEAVLSECERMLGLLQHNTC